MSLFDELTQDLKEAMKERNTIKLEAIRSLFAEVKKIAIDSGTREEVSDEIVSKVAKKRLKQGEDSIEKFEEAGREDLSTEEKEQLAFIKKYLPKMLDEETIIKIVEQKKQELRIQDKSDTGKLMGALMKEFQGKADGNIVKRIVSESLN